MPVTAAPSTGRRDTTRERLLTAARTLFVSRGYHLTRPQDIARLAGVGYGTFYLYFADKQACFLAFVAATQRELAQYLRPRLQPADRLDAHLTALMGGVLDYAAENPGVLRAATIDTSAITAENAADLSWHFANEWAKGLHEAMRRGTVASDYDPDIVGAMVDRAIGGALDAAGRGAARDAVIANAVKFLLRALQPREETPSDASPHTTE
jgi:AcrR family transcriptional regulator